MKKPVLTLLIVLLAFVCFSQEKIDEASKEAVRSEAKHLKARAGGARALGIASVSVGGMVTVYGIVLMIDGLSGDMLSNSRNNGYNGNYDKDGKRMLTGAIATLAGVGVGIVGGVIFFRKADKLNRQARIKLKSISTMVPQMNNSFTAVNMKAVPQMQLTYTIPL